MLTGTLKRRHQERCAQTRDAEARRERCARDEAPCPWTGRWVSALRAVSSRTTPARYAMHHVAGFSCLYAEARPKGDTKLTPPSRPALGTGPSVGRARWVVVADRPPGSTRPWPLEESARDPCTSTNMRARAATASCPAPFIREHCNSAAHKSPRRHRSPPAEIECGGGSLVAPCDP